MKNPSNLCGPAIARLRHKKAITQDELRQLCFAAGWDVARSVLAKIEIQTRTVCDRELVTLAHALGVTPHDLLGVRRKSRMPGGGRQLGKQHART